MKTDDQIPAPAALPTETTIPLRKPIQFATLEYAVLQLREPTAGEWEQWDGMSGVEADIKAISTVTGIPAPAALLLPASELAKASRWLGQFFSEAPATDAETGGDGPAEEKTIPLRRTVELGDNRYDALTLREPTAGEWQKWDKLSGVRADIEMLTIVTGWPRAAIEKIPVTEFIAASKWTARFLESGPLIGAA